MGLRSLSIDNEKNRRYLLLFQSGDEHALTYFYQKSFSSLFWVGKELISDEFLVSCILQECYLKVWAHRAKIESLTHAYRFIRMNLRWQVLKQIQSTPYQVYRQTVYIDHFEKTFGEIEDIDTGLNEDEQKQMNELGKVIGYLPQKQQLIANLHFIEGLPARQIAQRLQCNTVHVSGEIKKSVDQIKKMVQVKPNRSQQSQQEIGKMPYSHILNKQQAAVYALRTEQKMSFAGIADRLGCCQNQVQQHYLQAHQLIRGQGR